MMHARTQTDNALNKKPALNFSKMIAYDFSNISETESSTNNCFGCDGPEYYMSCDDPHACDWGGGCDVIVRYSMGEKKQPEVSVEELADKVKKLETEIKSLKNEISRIKRTK